MSYLLALDQGTTSSRSIIFDREGSILASAQLAFEQYFPRPGWVEHDPLEIWESQKRTIDQVIRKAGLCKDQVRPDGITNQRETTLIWS